MQSSFLKNNMFFSLLMLCLQINALHSQERTIEVRYERNDDKSIDFYYKKNKPGSYFLSLTFSRLDNCMSSGYKGVVQNESGLFLKLRPSNPKKGIGFAYKTSYITGNPYSKVDSLFVYALPFENGKKIGIVENKNAGEKFFGSERPLNWKSYRSHRINPDTVYAMRKGIVVDIKNKFETDTLFNKSFTTKRNTLTVEHSDGSFALYTGFKKNSFMVKLGQTIYPSTKLGVLDKITDGKYGHHLSFSFFFLSNIGKRDKQTLVNRKSRYQFFTPYFQTSEGIQKLKHKNKYFVEHNEELITKEFTRRERKKYAKNPETFQ